MNLLLKLKQLLCRVRQHELGVSLQWQPDEVCLQFGCIRCGEPLGHMHLPVNKSRAKEALH